MEKEREILDRAYRLLGDNVMSRLREIKVIVFGVGGVGSWCCESLVRTGIRNLTIVDSDCVCLSNINRQLMATTLTVGFKKVEALKSRLLEINPSANITAICESYSEATADDFNLDDYDYVVDAIDSLKDKGLLILRASASTAKLFSSMGAALKIDPARISVNEFWKVKGCPLARALRDRFKRNKTFPAGKFLCVYSDERLPNQDSLPLEKPITESGRETGKERINGSLVHITSIFGNTLAGLIISDCYKKF